MTALVRLPLALTLFGLLTLAGCATTPEDARRESPQKRASIQTQLAFEYLKEGNFNAAVEKLDMALAADDSYVDAHIAGGVIYNKLGEVEIADRHYKRALAIDPKNLTALNNYGLFLCSNGRNDEGIALFERALDLPLNTRPIATLNNAGQCAYESNQLDRAEKYLREVLDIDPQLPSALLTMGQVSFDTDRALSARAYLQRFHGVSAESAASLWLGVRAEWALGNPNLADRYGRKLNSAFPQSPEASEYTRLSSAP